MGDQNNRVTGKEVTGKNKTRHVKKTVYTFPTKGKKYLIPLGGPRGYLAGATRAILRTEGVRKGELWNGALTAITNSAISIKPWWVETEGPISQPVLAYFIHNAKQYMHFDTIEKTTFSMDIAVYDKQLATNKAIQLVTSRLEEMAFGPKRRAWMENVTLNSIN